MVQLFDNEKLCDLELCNLKLIQPKTGFRFGTDSVLLSDFTAPKKGQSIVDLGSGTGIIGFLLLGRQRDIKISALEIDSSMVERCERSIALNGLEDRFTVKNGDIRDIKKYYPANIYQTVVSNPPYFLENHAALVNDDEKTARTSKGCSFSDIAQAASYLLNTGGKFVTMCPSSRLFEMAYALKEAKFAAKKIRFVRSYKDKPPYLVLVEAKLHAKEGLSILDDLVVYEKENVYTEELRRIYHMEAE